VFIDLNDALNLTIENHPLIKMRKQDILASQNSLASSKWLAFPSVSSQTLPDRQGSGTTTMVKTQSQAHLQNKIQLESEIQRAQSQQQT
jgi:hypothetical protein